MFVPLSGANEKGGIGKPDLMINFKNAQFKKRFNYNKIEILAAKGALAITVYYRDMPPFVRLLVVWSMRLCIEKLTNTIFKFILVVFISASGQEVN